MKLNHPAKRLTAALLSGAMLFTLSAPALAADPGTAPDAAPAAAAPLNEENGSEDVVLTTNETSYAPPLLSGTITRPHRRLLRSNGIMTPSI